MEWEDSIIRDVLYTKAKEIMGTVSLNNLKLPVRHKEFIDFCKYIAPILSSIAGVPCTYGAVKNQIAFALDKQKACKLHPSHNKARALNRDAAIRAGFIVK